VLIVVSCCDVLLFILSRFIFQVFESAVNSGCRLIPELPYLHTHTSREQISGGAAIIYTNILSHVLKKNVFQSNFFIKGHFYLNFQGIV
jgi:hypothetical protein